MTEAAAGQPAGDALWDDWEVPPRVVAMPVLHLDGFDGPMDLLLDLAERQRIDLGRISFLALAEQFAAAMTALQDRVSLERRGDWLVMAARLVQLRARLLFAPTPEEEAAAAADAAAELRLLTEAAFIRAAARWLGERPQLGIDVFARPQSGPPPRVASYMALLEACLAVLNAETVAPTEAQAEPRYQVERPDLWRVPDALARMRAILPTLPQGEGRALRLRAAVASTLIAGLELARAGEARLAQVSDGAELMISAGAGVEGPR